MIRLAIVMEAGGNSDIPYMSDRVMTSPQSGNARPTPAIAVAVTDACPKASLFSNRLPHAAEAIAAAQSPSLADLMARRENLLLRLSQQIRNAPLDIDTSLAVAVREVRQLFNLDRCYFLWGWATTTDTADAHLPHGVLAVTHEDKREELASLVGECSPAHIVSLWPYLTHYQVLQITDLNQTAGLAPGLQEVLRSWGMTAQLLVPVETRSGQLGAIVCGHNHAHYWQADELRLLQAITTQLAIAMDQAELHAQTRAAATAAQTHAQQLTETLENLRNTQLQLIQSEKMSSLGHLVAGIAHEVNNPINFINGNLTHANSYFHALQQLIKAYQHYYPTPPQELQAYIEEIDLEFVLDDFSKLLSSMQIGTERIREIVLSLRNFSRLDEAELKPVDLHDGIDSTLLILQGRLKPKGAWSGIQIQKDYGDLPKVECHASQINQVLMNLLSNAIDALGDRPAPRWIKITTQLGVAAAMPTCEVVKITIQDNGPGIPESVRQRIFDPFFTTKPVGQGTGLGLSISYQIVVEKHQGWIRCDSNVGEGTTFTIEIPVAHTPAP